MDPQTEHHLAALILEEATRLRLQAERDGVHVYLAKPQVRGRPNPQFLQATVRSVEQANRAAEVNEMWRRRALELELEHTDERDRRMRGMGSSNEREEASRLKRHSHVYQGRHRKWSVEKDRSSNSCDTEHEDSSHRHHRSSSTRLHVSYAIDQISEDNSEHSHGVVDDLRDEGLKDDEVEQFLHARVKRGRGAIGSRMDEPGPYPLPQPGKQFLPDIRVKEDWEDRVMGPIAGPSVELERGEVLESKKHKKKKHKNEDVEGCLEESSRPKQKQKKKKERKEKHRSSERTSRKKRRKDNEF